MATKTIELATKATFEVGEGRHGTTDTVAVTARPTTGHAATLHFTTADEVDDAIAALTAARVKFAAEPPPKPI